MKITRLAVISLTAVLAFGCRYSSPSDDNDDGGSSTPEVPEVPEVPVEGGFAALTDTSTDNAGKLTYTLSSAQDTGMVSVKVRYAAGEIETAYVGLYSDTIKSADMIANIKMDSGYASGSDIGIKRATTSSSDDDQTVDGVVFTEDTWATVAVSWTATEYTLSVNGVPAGTWSVINENFVSAIQLKIGNNSNTTNYTFSVDDLAIYSDAAGTVEVHSDNFDDYDNDTDLANIDGYTNETNEAVAYTSDGGETDPDPTCEDSGQTGTYPDCMDIEVGDGPAPLSEFTFSGVDYSNTGTNTSYSVSATGSAAYTATSGATDVADTAMNMDQDAGFGYMSYTSDETAGAAEITGSFSVETVINQSSRAVASDVALVDYADTKAYLGFKTYIEKDDNSFKFKVYGGQVDDGNGGTTNLSTEAVTDPIATETWHHILAIYDAESLDGGDYGQLTVYINGEVAVQKDVDFELAKNVATDKFILMGGASSSDKNFDGDVDNVAVWNEALTAANVAERVAMFSTSTDEELTPLSEFTFSGVDYSNTGTNTNYAVGTSGSTAYTATSGATDVADTAMNMDQDAGFGYMSYTSDATAGAAEITGSFSVETVINQSSRAVASDVALVDYADTKAYLGFKTYIEKDDNSFKFKVYGGQVDDGNGGTTNLSTEAVTDPIATETWNHILAVYDAESLDGGDYGQLTVYINGVVAVQKDVDFELAKNIDTDKFILMGGASSSDKNFDGSVDNVAVWNEALTAGNVTERAALFGF